MYFNRNLEVPMTSSRDSEDLEQEDLPPQEDKLIYLGHKTYSHLTINLLQSKNLEKDTKRVVVKI
jgi:hypothetical protein